jgi:hypothetical protein
MYWNSGIHELSGKAYVYGEVRNSDSISYNETTLILSDGNTKFYLELREDTLQKVLFILECMQRDLNPEIAAN